MKQDITDRIGVTRTFRRRIRELSQQALFGKAVERFPVSEPERIEHGGRFVQRPVVPRTDAIGHTIHPIVPDLIGVQDMREGGACRFVRRVSFNGRKQSA